MAVNNGCTFKLGRAAYFIWWVERHCKLYQGVSAGNPYVFYSIADQPEWPIPDYFDWKDPEIRKLYEARFNWHCDLYDSGHFMDWQFECHARMYGWVRWSEHWAQVVRRFRKAIVFIAKKNKKSPSMAVNALYLTCADGQQGNQVNMFSKTKDQVSDNVFEHIVNMYRASASLQEMCMYNKAKKRITHGPSRSFVQPGSAGDKKTREAREGLNGDVLIDEAHVVPKELDTITKRAGISKPEFFQQIFSTAGRTGTSGWGREQFDFGLDVQNGVTESQSVFAAIYAPPQDTSPDDIVNDPIKYGKMANPALGHTVDPEELIADVQESRVKPEDLDDCMVYRFNIFRQEGSPAFNTEYWDSCRQKEFRLEDFYGQSCWAGIDMATHDDLCSLSYLFPRDQKYIQYEMDKETGIMKPTGEAFGTVLYLFVKCWKPRVSAKRESKVPYLAYEKEGLINLVDTPFVTLDAIYNEIEADSENFRILEMHYDPARMPFLTPRISGLNIEVIPFSQLPKTYHAVIELFQHKTAYRRIRVEDKNRLLHWQANHVQVREDKRNGYKSYVKPESGDFKKIDSISSSTMALRGYIIANPTDEEVSAYDVDKVGSWSRWSTI